MQRSAVFSSQVKGGSATPLPRPISSRFRYVPLVGFVPRLLRAPRHAAIQPLGTSLSTTYMFFTFSPATINATIGLHCPSPLLRLHFHVYNLTHSHPRCPPLFLSAACPWRKRLDTQCAQQDKVYSPDISGSPFSSPASPRVGFTPSMSAKSSITFTSTNVEPPRPSTGNRTRCVQILSFSRYIPMLSSMSSLCALHKTNEALEAPAHRSSHMPLVPHADLSPSLKTSSRPQCC